LFRWFLKWAMSSTGARKNEAKRGGLFRRFPCGCGAQRFWL
jgi:hypothetical protein